MLIIGQQHGNEPAGGEAALALAAELADATRASILDQINVLIVPRANPDGAFHFVRGLKNGGDVNRDHLLEARPKATRWGRYSSSTGRTSCSIVTSSASSCAGTKNSRPCQGYDALIQYADGVQSSARHHRSIRSSCSRQPLLRSARRRGIADVVGITRLLTTSTDRKVSMGGVVPDTGRNIAGLRNAVSFLIETRGVGIGRAHFKRRVSRRT
mgnify:CR=1 FL=1